jgi:hypothetical protein
MEQYQQTFEKELGEFYQEALTELNLTPRDLSYQEWLASTEGRSLIQRKLICDLTQQHNFQPIAQQILGRHYLVTTQCSCGAIHISH